MSVSTWILHRLSRGVHLFGTSPTPTLSNIAPTGPTTQNSKTIFEFGAWANHVRSLGGGTFQTCYKDVIKLLRSCLKEHSIGMGAALAFIRDGPKVFWIQTVFKGSSLGQRLRSRFNEVITTLIGWMTDQSWGSVILSKSLFRRGTSARFSLAILAKTVDSTRAEISAAAISIFRCSFAAGSCSDLLRISCANSDIPVRFMTLSVWRLDFSHLLRGDTSRVSPWFLPL